MLQSLQNLSRTLLAALMALCLMVAATHTLAQTSGISLQDAEHIALQLFPNSSVESVERDVDRGVPVYEVELRDDRGVEHEVIIDAQNGRVIRTHVDD